MMSVPLLDLRTQYATIRAEILEAIERVCDSQQFILGPEVLALEEEIAGFCGVRFAVGVSSGTDALLAALMAAGVGPGDEVVTTPYSFFATAGAIGRLGAVPVFADIESSTFNLDAKNAVGKMSTKTKAILPVHLFGRCAVMDPILEVARERDIVVIEDAAQAIGARDGRGRQAGALGDMGCFSFFPTKNLGGFGDGGMVVTNDERLAQQLRMIRVHGAKMKYRHEMVGGNFRLDAIQAAVLRVKLGHLNGWTAARRRNADRYRHLFRNDRRLAGRVEVPEDEPGHVYNQFVIELDDRDRVQRFLKDRGIGSEVYYPVPLHLQPCFRTLGHREGDFPGAERASRRSLAIPVYPELTEDQQRVVVSAIAECLTI